METLLSIAVALCAGLLVSRFVKPLKLPAVTGYLIAGILIGPYCLGKLGVPGLGFPTTADVKALSLFNDVALGFIAFAIGNEFRLSQLRETGKQATVIGIFQALTATLMVDLMLIGLHFFILGDSISVADAIVLGAIATATAPAATLMVVRQYKAKGELTDLLLPIVALDDAVGLIVFAVSFGIAKAINCGNYDMVSILVEPLLEIVFSVLLGFVMGGVFSAAEKYFKSNSKRLSLSIAFVILTVALSMMEFEVGGVKIGFSSLLVCMMIGATMINVSNDSPALLEQCDRFTPPLFLLFFVLSGASLDLSVLPTVGVVGIAYVLSRAIGKSLGATIGAAIEKCDKNIIRYLGMTLIPQAGVAIGMARMCLTDLPAYGSTINAVVLAGTLIYELTGPVITKIALTKAGEIKEGGAKPAAVTAAK